MCSTSGLHSAAVYLSVCLSVVCLSAGTFLQSDTLCLWSNWVRKIRKTGCVREKPECSLHLTSSLFDHLVIRLQWASVNWRECGLQGIKNHITEYSQCYRGIIVKVKYLSPFL